MRFTIDVNINLKQSHESEIIDILNKIFKQNTEMALTVKDLENKVDLMQTTIDETQATALEKITTLETTVQELKDIIAAGGNNEAELQVVADKLDAATSDLKATFPTPPTP